uniref:Uncharacterized protein n=1 Tax=Tanacetum cinerariifolium TaxID=118510 RepID=A0A699H410_TANCI|nr:hypothetical protein [Tanacetum cinerariifolium]
MPYIGDIMLHFLKRNHKFLLIVRWGKSLVKQRLLCSYTWYGKLDYLLQLWFLPIKEQIVHSGYDHV